MTDNEFRCPKCGMFNEIVDEFEYLPWTDSEESELECDNCGQKVTVTAHVRWEHEYKVTIDGLDYDVNDDIEYELAYDKLNPVAEEDEE
jgi:uncharacterized Zn finger protein